MSMLWFVILRTCNFLVGKLQCLLAFFTSMNVAARGAVLTAHQRESGHVRDLAISYFQVKLSTEASRYYCFRDDEGRVWCLLWLCVVTRQRQCNENTFPCRERPFNSGNSVPRCALPYPAPRLDLAILLGTAPSMARVTPVRR